MGGNYWIIIVEIDLRTSICGTILQKTLGTYLIVRTSAVYLVDASIKRCETQNECLEATSDE